MIVMVSNNTGWRTHYLQGRYGNVGLLLPPNGLRGPYPHLPHYALDNGAFPASKNNAPWDESAFLKALDWAVDRPISPHWIVVPDVVGDASQTFRLWDQWRDRVRDCGVPLAFAVQDGMTPDAVIAYGIDAEVIFVGGSTDWKRRTLSDWCKRFPRVHVGRINGIRGLHECANAGAESCDGTGWFRGDRNQLAGLVRFLREQSAPGPESPMYFPRTDDLQGSLFA